jgi:hypothetical protein
MKKLKWRKESAYVWSANLFTWCDLMVDIIIGKEDDYYRICVDYDQSIMYNLGNSNTLKEAKALANKEVELFVKINLQHITTTGGEK